MVVTVWHMEIIGLELIHSGSVAGTENVSPLFFFIIRGDGPIGESEKRSL